jgi:hypothetical protein
VRAREMLFFFKFCVARRCGWASSEHQASDKADWRVVMRGGGCGEARYFFFCFSSRDAAMTLVFLITRHDD